MDSVGQAPAGGDRNLGPVIIAVNVVVLTLSTLVVILRTITRLFLTRNFGWDDAMMVFTQVLTTAVSSAKYRILTDKS